MMTLEIGELGHWLNLESYSAEILSSEVCNITYDIKTEWPFKRLIRVGYYYLSLFCSLVIAARIYFGASI